MPKMVTKERHKYNPKRFIVLFLLLFIIASIAFIKFKGSSWTKKVDLENGFMDPPDSSKPRVWWHWMNGNVNKEGIKADLEWMKRVGIGGFQNFDGNLGTPKNENLPTPQIVKKRLVYMTPEWKDAFLFTTRLADSLGLEMAIASSPGWSQSGGPWVTPAQAMKKLVWSEIWVDGGKPFKGILPKPPTNSGPFQNIAHILHGTKLNYYTDVAVVAYRVPENDIPIAVLKPKVTSSSGKFDFNELIDGDLEKSTFLPITFNEKSWIQFEFTKPETIQSISIADDGNDYRCKSISSRTLETSDDGLHFKTVLELARPTPHYSQVALNTITFPPVSARFFRVTFTIPLPEPKGVDSGGSKKQGETTSVGTLVAELVLHTIGQVNRFEDKAGFTSATNIYTMATPSVPSYDAIKKDEVVDLSSKMQPDGTFNWTPPAGRWVVLRLGYSLKGSHNHPAVPEATGLEVDKLSAEHVKAYFTNYLDKYKDATGGLMGKKGLQYIVTDSWEAGVQNWTDNMMAEFYRHRGYDILQWLPVLTGRIVESAEASDRFLWDFRKTIADLTVENYYDQLTTILHDRGMIGRYSESHEESRAFVADGMDVKRTASVPMSALWAGGYDGFEMSKPYASKALDLLESASVAHIYGQNLVAAESFTTNGKIPDDKAWIWSPEQLKPSADMLFANGVNRIVIHCSVHQPVNDKIPGIGLGWFGQWFTRHETWAEQAKPWITYLARSSYMLQQGKFVADVIYFYGEDNNVTALNELPDIPLGYNYDFVNADALVNCLSVKNGKIITPNGTSYGILALDPNCKYMSLPVLRKISKMVQAGAVVVGNKPINSPSLMDDQVEFKAISDNLWGKGTGENTFGRGKVYANQSISKVLSSLNIVPDFEYTKSQDSTDHMFIHRKVDDVEIYWVNNCSNNDADIDATFRVKGKTPELWHPESGIIEKASYHISEGRTTVPLRMNPNDAVFVVFRKKTDTTSFTFALPVETQLASIESPWNVSFQPNRGAPTQIVLNKLTSWSENADPGVKYFSGTGNYTKTIQVPDAWFKEGSQIWLDLGKLRNLAEVVVNGKSMGIVWKTPFRVNVTEALKKGENLLEVKVTNTWVNRLIGDQQPGNTQKITYTNLVFYQANSPLLPSGLFGPVKILSLTAN